MRKYAENGVFSPRMFVSAYRVIIYFSYRYLGIPIKITYIFLVTGLQFLTVLITYRYFKRLIINHFAAFSWAIVVNMLGSIIVFPFINNLTSLGAANSLHNPTYAMMKPFALVTIFLFLDLINRLGRQMTETNDTVKLKVGDLLWIGMALLGATMLKPSFTLVFVPASVLFLFFLLLKHSTLKNSIRISSVFVLMSIPSLLMIAYQYKLVYAGDNRSSIMVDYFHRVISTQGIWFIPNLLVTLLLPALVGFAEYRRSSRELRTTFIFALLMWVIAFIQSGLLAEQGPRYMHGNLCWGILFAQFFLFLASVLMIVVNHADHVRNLKDCYLEMKQEILFAVSSLIIFLFLLRGVAVHGVKLVQLFFGR